MSKRIKRERGNAPSYLARVYTITEALAYAEGKLEIPRPERRYLSMFSIVTLGRCDGPSPDQSRRRWSQPSLSYIAKMLTFSAIRARGARCLALRVISGRIRHCRATSSISCHLLDIVPPNLTQWVVWVRTHSSSADILTIISSVQVNLM